MIKVVAQNYIKADKVEEFIVLAEKLVQATRKNDAGCIRYELLQEVENPQILTMLEEWEDQEALNQHAASRHCKEVASRFADFMEKPAEMHIYQLLA